MGLDQYAGLRDSNGKVHEEFYWRKHARLQKFFAEQFAKQNQNGKKHNTGEEMQHLGFNAGQGGVKITEEVIKELEKTFKSNYHWHFCADGFFWGQQFQEEQMKEYKAQDKKFIKWAKEQLKAGKDIGYDCSW